MSRARRTARRVLARVAASRRLHHARRPRTLTRSDSATAPIGYDDAEDIAVVGGGAAGLAAAIFAAERALPRRPRIVVLDGAPRIGAKILISGGGRCNVSHETVRAEDFNGTRPIVRNVLAAFDASATARWFASMGVPLKREETGKLFPVSNRAETVVDALLARCAALGIRIATGTRVLDVRDDAQGRWRVRHANGELTARAVVMATGGRSLPRTGSDGSGWEIVARLGHGVTSTVPALVPLVLGAGFHRELSGVSQPVELQTFIEDTLADRRAGSLLWTHFGVSGPVVLDTSRHWTTARHAGRAVAMRCGFFPGEGFDAVEQRLLATSRARPRTSISRALAATLPDRVAVAVAVSAGVRPGMRLAEMSRAQRRTLTHALTGLVLPVERERGWNYAEATAGGVPLEEIDFRTMQSRKRRGLYLIGEMLDCDGRIGGFNFQWAWSTGFIAGRAAASQVNP